MPILMTSHTIIERIYSGLKPRISELAANGQTPTLAVVLVGDDPNSITYVSIKQQRAEELGMEFILHRLDTNTAEERVLSVIDELNRAEHVHGIIVQLPLPAHLDSDKIIARVSQEKDVDGLRNRSPFMPPTVRAIMQLFEAYDIVLKDKKIVVVGQGRLVGGPLTEELRRLHFDVSICDESTSDLGACTLQADILVSATGEHHLIQPSMVKEGSIIIDVDTEVDYELVSERVGYITPQKGGVGPLTVAYLLSNTVEAAESQANRRGSE